MALSWLEINAEIADCRAGPDPITCLRELFARVPDGHVAFNLGEELERRDDAQALEWYERAERLYPRDVYRKRARAAADRVRRRLGEDPTTTALVIVACTKRKVWAERPDAATFVPAQDAYTGRSVSEWLASDGPRSGVPWLILSARYGFIEPEHPIADYDVTFGDPSTGPLSSESLRAQVIHQTRLSGARLRDFRRVEVVGPRTYLDRVVAAYRGTGAEVVPREVRPEPRPGETSAPTGTGASPAGLALRADAARADALGRALAGVGLEVIDAIDRGEPEWPVLERLSTARDEIAVLAALALGLADYRLGPGGADRYWGEALAALDAAPPTSPADVGELLGRLLDHPVSEPQADQKRRRIDRLLSSDLPGWLGQVTIEGVGEDLAPLWRRLAGAMGNPQHAKTIVFSVKLVDLLHLIRTGRRARMAGDMPIAVDVRVARASIASGVVRTGYREPAGALLARPSEELLAEPQPIIAAWSRVASHTEHPALRLDSLVWQAASHLRAGVDGTRARAGIAAMLVGYGAPAEVADAVAGELAFELR